MQRIIPTTILPGHTLGRDFSKKVEQEKTLPKNIYIYIIICAFWMDEPFSK